MKLLCSVPDFEKAKNTDFLPLECEKCKTSFLRRKSTIKRAMYYLAGMNKARKTLQYCSAHCSNTGNRQKKQKLHSFKCKNPSCGKFYVTEERHSKFCSKSCQAKGSFSKKKRKVTTRSRAEKYLFEKIAKALPEEPILSNDRSFLDSGLEIDIFLPQSQLAIEVNGPHHYKPLFGAENLKKVQHRDRTKASELEEKNVLLIQVDISGEEHGCWKVSKHLLDQSFDDRIWPIIRDYREQGLQTARNQILVIP